MNDLSPTAIDQKQGSMRKTPSPWLACLLSAVALAGSRTAWELWSTNGGWHRADHKGEVILWTGSLVIGLWGSVDSIANSACTVTTSSSAPNQCPHIDGFHAGATDGFQAEVGVLEGAAKLRGHAEASRGFEENIRGGLLALYLFAGDDGLE